jgi:predicted sulfurtransferase
MKARRIFQVFVICVAVLMAGALWAAGSGSNDVPKVSTKEVRGLLDNGNAVIIDVRSEWDWAKSKVKIRGAVREEPAQVDKWAAKYAKDKRIILYCA